MSGDVPPHVKPRIIYLIRCKNKSKTNARFLTLSFWPNASNCNWCVCVRECRSNGVNTYHYGYNFRLGMPAAALICRMLCGSTSTKITDNVRLSDGWATAMHLFLLFASNCNQDNCLAAWQQKGDTHWKRHARLTDQTALLQSNAHHLPAPTPSRLSVHKCLYFPFPSKLSIHSFQIPRFFLFFVVYDHF